MGLCASRNGTSEGSMGSVNLYVASCSTDVYYHMIASDPVTVLPISVRISFLTELQAFGYLRRR
jgi:hypothetical protein